MPETISVADEREMTELGARLAHRFGPYDTVLLYGDLGAGKTTLVRGVISELRHVGPVRSPTFNLLQLYATQPPTLHADLYRVKSAAGIGLEDYLEQRLCLIEWPDRLEGTIDFDICWQIHIRFDGTGRVVEISQPSPT